MGNWNLGSVSTALLNLVPNIPSSISGVQLDDVAERQRLFIEDYTGLTVGSVGIAPRFQPALLNLSAAETLRFVHLHGGDMSIDGIRVGNSALSSAEKFQETGMTELRRLGNKGLSYKVFG